MADEIAFGYVTGADLKYGAYQPDGTVRTAAGTSLTEVAGTGLYLADDADVIAGDLVIVKSGTVVVGAGEYLPYVTASAASLEDVTSGIDAVALAQSTVQNDVDETARASRLLITENI